MPGKQETEPTGKKPTTSVQPAANEAPVDAANAANVQDKYEPPTTNREITQTDRLNKQLLESLLNRMQAAAQATVPDADDDDEDGSSDDKTAPPRNNIDWE